MRTPVGCRDKRQTWESDIDQTCKNFANVLRSKSRSREQLPTEPCSSPRTIRTLLLEPCSSGHMRTMHAEFRANASSPAGTSALPRPTPNPAPPHHHRTLLLPLARPDMSRHDQTCPAENRGFSRGRVAVERAQRKSSFVDRKNLPNSAPRIDVWSWSCMFFSKSCLVVLSVEAIKSCLVVLFGRLCANSPGGVPIRTAVCQFAWRCANSRISRVQRQPAWPSALARPSTLRPDITLPLTATPLFGLCTQQRPALCSYRPSAVSLARQHRDWP